MSTRSRAILIVLAAALVVGIQLVDWGTTENPAVLDAVKDLGGQWVDRPAPPIELPDTDGKTRHLSDYRGKVVFLNFWASYCAPCRKEMPSMERLIRQYRDQGLVMVAVSLDPKEADVDRFMARFLPDQRTAMTVLWDPKSETGNRFGTELIPETYIIDRKGRIVARFVNAYDWTRPEVKQLIEALIRSEDSQHRVL